MVKAHRKGKLLKIVFLMCLVIAVSVTVAILVVKKAEETGVAVHESLWKATLDGAKTDKYDKYAIYASRILAVKHPEVYLQGDAIFLKHITSHNGYQKEYLIKDVHDVYFYAQDMVGPPFSFNDVNFENYSPVSFTEIYPENYPLFSYLDRRLLPIASTLKLWENKITQLELGEQFYFSLRENRNSTQGLYIIYCGNEETYVYDSGKLTWMRNLTNTNVVSSSPILIFNEENVWYPLMDRDDTSKDFALDNVVRKYYPASVATIAVTKFEYYAIKVLKQVTELDNENQILMATVAAAHTEGTHRGAMTYPEFSVAWDNLGVPWYANELFREIYKRANYLSPITAYLAWISQKQAGETKISTLTNEYLDHTRAGYSYAWGHTWSCTLVGQTIDECYRTRAGHCVWQAASIAAVLDAINVSNYTIEGYDASLPNPHSWLYLPEYDIIVSDGMIESYGTVLVSTLNAIININHGGKWAHPVLNFYIGTFSPKESVGLFNYLKSIHDDDIKGLGVINTGFSVVSYSELISGLAQEYWMSIQLP
jgi:hypothetical protein